MKTQHPVSASRTRSGRRLRLTDKLTQTIGDVLGYLSDGNTAAEGTVSKISDGVFQTSFLARYTHRFELVLCCAMAIQELADLPCNPKNRAAVMGRAMELLREKHDLDAPRGWYPVMKKLRARADDSADRFQPHEDDGDDEDSDIVPPEEVLSSDYSVLNFVDKKGELGSLALKRPEIKAAFVSLARERGVPKSYKEGLEFLNTLLKRLETAPDTVLMVRDELQRRAEEVEPHQTIPVAHPGDAGWKPSGKRTQKGEE